MADIEDDVPPLDDFSPILQKLSKSIPAENFKVKAEEATVSEQLQPEESQPPLHVEPRINQYAGMKKGFLSSSNASPRSNTKQQAAALPFIKKQKGNDGFQIPEVQQAMLTSDIFTKNSDWLTPDLFGSIKQNAGLMQKFTNPSFMMAVSEFQVNPTAAAEKYKDNEDLQNFFKDFAALMGNHFSNLTAKDPPRGENSPIATHASEGADMRVLHSTDANQSTAQDEETMRRLLQDPQIRDIMLDPKIQALIETLRVDPDKAQRVLQTCDPEFSWKIRRLCDVGILQFKP